MANPEKVYPRTDDCGTKFLFTSANHSLRSFSTYSFPIFFEEWDLDRTKITDA